MTPLRWLLLAGALCVPLAAAAFTLTGKTWPAAAATFWVSIPEQAGIFNDAFEEAMAEWEATGQFDYLIVPGVYADPCGEPPLSTQNGVGFEADFCGDVWGANTLAATTIWFVGSTTILTGVAFNSGKTWDLYEGPRPGSGPYDFRRVAVHELGHALGLDHTTEVGVMQSVITNFEVPEFDDWGGVASMYGGGVVPDILAISPRGLYTPSGPPGGPFGAEVAIYWLRNTGAAPLDYSVSDTASWTSIDGASGTIVPGGTATVGVWVNASAAALGTGQHTSTLTFGNTTSGNGTVLQMAEIDVGPDDSDSDGFLNAVDNCVGVQNFAQSNADALPAGDTCQCGDLNSDYQVDLIDRIIIERINGGRSMGLSFDQRRCSVGGDLTACDGDDSTAVQNWLARVVTDLPNRCEAAIP